MRKLPALVLALALALGLAGCLPAPTPTQAQPAGKVWSLYVNHTRLARLNTGGNWLVYACTLEGGFFKRGGDTPAGSYEGQLMLSFERDCYQQGLYTAQPAGIDPFDPGRRSYAWSVPMSFELAEAEGANGAPARAGAGWTGEMLAALEAAPLAGEASESALVSLGDIDDFGDALPAEPVPEALWQTDPLWVEWEEGYALPGWGEFCALAAALAQEADNWDYAPTAPSPGWDGLTGAPAIGGSLPMWVAVSAGNRVDIWLPGVMPLEGERPFTGMLYSGDSVPVSVPSPPGLYDAPPKDGEAQPEDSGPASASASSHNPFAAWLERPSSSGASGGLSLPASGDPSSSSAASGPSSRIPLKKDPLKQALEEYHLPMPGGKLSGPKERDGVYVYTVEGFDYRDAVSYGRKLKMGGYRSVMNEVEQPVLDLYTLVAQTSGRQIALQYKSGQTEISLIPNAAFVPNV